MCLAVAIFSAVGECASDNVEILQECGVSVVPTPSSFAPVVKDVLDKAS